MPSKHLKILLAIALSFEGCTYVENTSSALTDAGSGNDGSAPGEGGSDDGGDPVGHIKDPNKVPPGYEKLPDGAIVPVDDGGAPEGDGGSEADPGTNGWTPVYDDAGVRVCQGDTPEGLWKVNAENKCCLKEYKFSHDFPPGWVQPVYPTLTITSPDTSGEVTVDMRYGYGILNVSHTLSSNRLGVYFALKNTDATTEKWAFAKFESYLPSRMRLEVFPKDLCDDVLPDNNELVFIYSLKPIE